MVLSIVTAIILFGVYNAGITRYFSFLPNIAMIDISLVLRLLAVAAIVALLAGIYPSIVLSSLKPVSLFKQKKTSIQRNFQVVNFLVVLQFALCIVLIVCSLMTNKQIRYIKSLETGYAKDELITIPLNMNIHKGINNKRLESFAKELKKYPSIKNVSFSFSSPSSINSEGDSEVSWDGKTEDKEVLMSWESVSYDYFETIGVEIIQGRNFSGNHQSDQVNWDNMRCGFILNESAIEKMGIFDPIGKEFAVWGFRGTIIGIVEDYYFKSMHSGISPIFYQVNPIFWSQIIIRIDPLNTSVFKNIETVWNKFFIGYPLEFNSVDDQIQSLYLNDQNLAKTLSIFSLLAILISSIGLFTLTVLSLSQRTKEIGIRKVNGAKISEILILLGKEYIKLVFIAFIFATPVAFFAMHKWLENFANKTNLSWWIFAMAGILTLGIALLTVSWRSMQVANRDPVEALRYE